MGKASVQRRTHPRVDNHLLEEEGFETGASSRIPSSIAFYFTLSRMNRRFNFFPMPPRFSSIDAIRLRQSPSGAGSVAGDENGFFSNPGFSGAAVSRRLLSYLRSRGLNSPRGFPEYSDRR